MATRRLPCEKLSGVWELPGRTEPVVVEDGEIVKELVVKGELATTEE